MNLLIVNADDFGLNSSANAGIIECYRAGSVTSTTLMANAPGVEEALVLARENPGLRIGLHFNLTWGRPLCRDGERTSLVTSDGAFLSRPEVGRRAVTGRLRQKDLDQELEAQFQLLRSRGVEVTHVDTHQHVHAFGCVFSAIARLCERERLPMRVPWVAPSRNASISRSIRRTALAMSLFPSVCRWRGRVRWNDGIGSVFDIGSDGSPLAINDYRSILVNAKPGSFELMVHPVKSASAMQGYTRVGAVGEAEYRWLRTGALRGLAEALGFQLGSYSDLSS